MYIAAAKKVIEDTYKCAGGCSTEILADWQWMSANVTSNVPETIKYANRNSLFDWDNTLGSQPEYNYYANITGDTTHSGNLDFIRKLRDIPDSNSDFVLEHIQLEKLFTLIQKGVTESFIYSSFTEPERFIKLMSFMIQEMNFKEKLTDYDITSVLYGYSEQNLQLLRKGKHIDNFQPIIQNTTGFYQTDRLYDNRIISSLTLKTGFSKNEKDSLREISKINGINYYNMMKNVYSSTNDTFYSKQVPLFNSKLIENLNEAFQFSSTKNSVRIFDALSSRYIEFIYKNTSTVSNIDCYLYTMNTNLTADFNESRIIPAVNSLHGTVYEKFNKPYVIEATSNLAKNGNIAINGNTSTVNFDEDYICIDPYSNIVIGSKYTLIVKDLD